MHWGPEPTVAQLVSQISMHEGVAMTDELFDEIMALVLDICKSKTKGMTPLLDFESW
jgi:hypothetical protein